MSTPTSPPSQTLEIHASTNQLVPAGWNYTGDDGEVLIPSAVVLKIRSATNSATVLAELTVAIDGDGWCTPSITEEDSQALCPTNLETRLVWDMIVTIDGTTYHPIKASPCIVYPAVSRA